MSFEAFVHCFKDGKVASVSRQRVREAFGSSLTEGGVYDWQLDYCEADSCNVILGVDDADKSLLHSFTVLRPCGDVRFWDAMATILKLGNLVLFFPASCPPLIAEASVARHLPPDMIESLGQPKCVNTGREILDALHAA